MIILCDCKDCIHHVTLKNEGSAYQGQCGADEIEVGKYLDIAICYSLEEKSK